MSAPIFAHHMSNKMERLPFKTQDEIISNSLKDRWYKYCSLRHTKVPRGDALKVRPIFGTTKVPSLNMLVSKM
jgi:hypothetical protein